MKSFLIMLKKGINQQTHLGLLAALTLILGVGCSSPVPTGAVCPKGWPMIVDAPGNLSGDQTRTYMDILQTTIWPEGEYCVLEVETAGPFPRPTEMGGGKRFDFIWLIDIDKSRSTGQTAEGNDYNIHLFLDESGWHTAWIKVSDLSKHDAVTINPDDIHPWVEGSRARLIFPRSYLPSRSFEMWATCTSINAENWPPRTVNPNTKRMVFSF